MSPRKRMRPSPAEKKGGPSSIASQPSGSSRPSQASTAEEAASSPSVGSATMQQPQPQIASDAASIISNSTISQARKEESWYGSWPRAPKSSASTQLARETILGGTLKPASSPDFRRFDMKRSSDLSAGLDGAQQSAVTLPLPPHLPLPDVAELSSASTPMDLDKGPAAPPPENTDEMPVDEQLKAGGTSSLSTETTTSTTTALAKPGAPTSSTSRPSTPIAIPAKRPSTASGAGWLQGWLGRSPGQASVASVPEVAVTEVPHPQIAELPGSEPEPRETGDGQQKQQQQQQPGADADDAPKQPMGLPAPRMLSQPANGAPSVAQDSLLKVPGTQGDVKPADEQAAPEPGVAPPQAAWYQFWATSPATAAQTPRRAAKPDEASKEATTTEGAREPGEDVVMGEAPPLDSSTEAPAAATTTPSEPPVPVPPPASAQPSAGSTWAFWSRDTRRKPSAPASNGKAVTTATSSSSSTAGGGGGGGAGGRATPEPGELAVMGDRSEAHPMSASAVEVREGGAASSSSADEATTTTTTTTTGGKGKAKGPAVVPPLPKEAPAAKQQQLQQRGANKRLRPRSIDLDDSSGMSSPARPGTPQQQLADPLAQTPATTSKTSPGKVAGKEPATTTTTPGQASTSATAAGPSSGGGVAAAAGASSSSLASKLLPPNLLLPAFRTTYRLKDNPSILRQLAQLLRITSQPAAGNHVFLAGGRELPRIRKAIAIGVHGLFPAAYLRPMIGQPTGTSIKFANHCADAIRRWADEHGCGGDGGADGGEPALQIEKIALEGEGKIADRVDNLWRLLLNWIDHLRSADLIVIACHSQGVPVGIMLVAKLIDLGIITSAKIGVCAMAGVSLGPFPDYKSGMGMLMGTAAELWEFSNPESEVSKRYEHSLKLALSYGVRITYIGSIDDQLVPVESAIYSPANHPYIYRAVFIDGRIHAPDFIAHLVGFALKLRNLGVSDHGLIRELSAPLAGSLYGGEGHSRLYEDPQVYDLAVTHALETTSVGDVTCRIQKFEGISNANPYHLPWIMRGLLEEDFVKTELSAETAELLRQFDDWKPVTKALKDVKYRLEAVRSKL